MKLFNKDLEEVFTTKNIPQLHPINNQSTYDMKTDYLHLGKSNSHWKNAILIQGTFVPRWMAEKDSSIVQIIPYVLCCTSDTKILSYNRKGGGEERLEGKKSIGIGGHININDISLDNKELSWDLVINGATRELAEELTIDSSEIINSLTEIGIIYTPLDGGSKSNKRLTTDTPTVGAVHLGIVYMLKVSKNITIRDNEGMINPKFIKISDAYKELSKYETWSKMILETLTDIKNLNKKNES